MFIKIWIIDKDNVKLYIKLLKSKENIGYDDLVKISKKTKNLIFNCFEKKYLNKCEIRGELMPNPFDFI